MRNIIFACVGMLAMWSPAALPCSAMPPSFGDVNLGKDGILNDAPLWVQILSTTSTIDTFPIIVTNKTSNQPVSYTVDHNHRDGGVFPPRYFKLMPEVGTWGEVGDKIELSVDDTAWFQNPIELPEVEIVAEGVSMNDTVFVPPMFWSDQMEITPITPNSCWPMGGYKIDIPFMVYETLVPWGYLLVYTDNHEDPIRMIGTEPLHVDASNGQILRAWTHDDPGRCIQIVPMNLMDEAFEAVEFCMPEVETPPDAGVMMADAGWTMTPLDSGVVTNMDAGMSFVVDGGFAASHTSGDGGTSATNSGGSTSTTTDDGGANTPEPVDEGCGCSQTKARSDGFFHVGWLVLALLTRRRFRGRA